MKEKILNSLDAILRHLFPNGEIHKDEFCIGNISGDKGKSLNIRIIGNRKGLWLDRATGEKGDVIDLWNRAKGFTSFKDGLEDLKKFCGINEEQQPTPVFAGRWDYLDKEGNLVCYIVRQNIGGKKRFFQYLPDGKLGLPETRTLYNLHKFEWHDEIIFVEGEKCAEALMNVGICATALIGGSNSPLEKTDFSPLKNKKVIIWRDSDSAGIAFKNSIVNKLETLDIDYEVLTIPPEFPEKYDAYDLIEEGKDPDKFIKEADREVPRLHCQDFLDAFLGDRPVEDIIQPRVLVPGGTLLVAGQPKIGKTDFLLKMFLAFSRGEDFLGLKSNRKLKTLYIQTEVKLPYLMERIDGMGISKQEIESSKGYFYITSKIPDLIFDENGMKKVKNEILHLRKKGFVPDVICLDPLADIFSSDIGKGDENDNAAMKNFLKVKLEGLRSFANPEAGIILVHHLRKSNSEEIIENPFEAIRGASSLRGHYDAGIVIAHETVTYKKLFFEIRNGRELPSKTVYKDSTTGKWIEEKSSFPIVRKDYSALLDEEKERKRDALLSIIAEQALQGNTYTKSTFADKFAGIHGLGSKHTVNSLLKEYLVKGKVKFFHGEAYGLEPFKFLCVKDMKLETPSQNYYVEPSHYMNKRTGAIIEVEDKKTWVEEK